MITFFGPKKNRKGGQANSSRTLSNIASAFILSLFALGFVGCSTNNTTITGGASLAKAGQTAATQMQQSVTLSGGSILTLKKAVAFNDGYNNAVGNTNSSQFLANVSSIQVKLNQYGNWLQSLSASYSALGDLANYDAVGNLDSSIASLAVDTTNFANAIGKPVVVPPDATAGVEIVGNFLIGLKQSSEVKQASKNIQGYLTNVIAMLEVPETKRQLITIHKEVTGQIDQAAEVIFLNGIVSYSTLLDDLGSPLELKSVTNADAIVKANKPMLAGLQNVAIESFNDQLLAQESAYDQSLSALKALVPLHENLQKGVPLNLNTLANIISQLQTTAATLSTKTK